MKTARSLKWWQWETLLVTMGGYALYYLIRKNLSIAMPLLGEIGVSKVQLGAFLTAGGVVYGVGRFLNGIVADRNSARTVMMMLANGFTVPSACSEYMPRFWMKTLTLASCSLSSERRTWSVDRPRRLISDNRRISTPWVQQ